MLPREMQPRDNVRLERLGSRLDGGYWVAPRSIAETKRLLSFGLSDNWDFESDFTARSSALVDCFDHTIGSRFWLKQALLYIANGELNRLGRYFSYRRFFSGGKVLHHHI